VARPSIRFQDGAIDGSPGCGHFSGAYKKSGDSLIVAAKWSNDAQTPCNEEEKDDAAKIIEALGNVRRIGVPPRYWHDDAVLLNDAKGKIQLALSPKKTVADLSGFHDSYWRLNGMKGPQADFRDTVVSISGNDISFNTPKCIFAFPFTYEMAGLEFFPAWERTDEKACGDDLRLVQTFERNLHLINSYSAAKESLTFFDGDHQPIIKLSPLRSTTIEYRTWRIAKYFDPATKSTDKNPLAEAKRRATISFVNGRVDGGPGCGAWVGTYKLSGAHLTLDAGAALAGLCRPEEEAQSNLVVKDLKGNLRIEQTGDDILLKDETGYPRIELVPF